MSGRYHRTPLKRVDHEITAAGLSVTKGLDSTISWDLPSFARTDDMQLLHPFDMQTFASFEDVEAWYSHSPEPVVYALTLTALKFSGLAWFRSGTPTQTPEAVTEVALRMYGDQQLAVPFAQTAHNDFLRYDPKLMTPLWTSLDKDSIEEIEIFKRLGYDSAGASDGGHVIMTRE